jgi:hypothetical protein
MEKKEAKEKFYQVSRILEHHLMTDGIRMRLERYQDELLDIYNA